MQFTLHFTFGAGGGATRTRVTKIVHWTIFTFVLLGTPSESTIYLLASYG